MYNYRGGTGLPFDPERVDTRNMVQNRPQLGRVDLGQMTEFAGPLVDGLIIQIQDNAERTPLRTFAFNYWADGGFRNKQFVELLTAFAAHVESFLLTQGNADPMVVIDGEAEFFVASATAMLVELFPEMKSYLPPEAAPLINASINDWHGIVRNIKVAQRQLGGGGRGGQYHGRGNEYGGRQGGNYHGGGMRRSLNAPTDVSRLHPSWEQDQNYQRPDQGTTRTGFNSSSSPVRQDDPGMMGIKRITDPGKPSQSPAKPQGAYRRGSVQTEHGSRLESLERPFDKIELGDGRVMVPAMLSEWKVNLSTAHPPFVFNRETHMLFHVKNPDGGVLEAVQEKVSQMSYLEHELDEKLKKLHRQNEGIFAKEITVPEMQLTRRLAPNKEGKLATSVTKEERHALDAAGAPRQLTKPFHVSSLKEAIFQAQLESFRLEGDVDFLEYEVIENDQAIFADKALQSVLAVGREDRYSGVIAKILALHQEDDITDELMEKLDKRLTAEFNRYNHTQLFLTQTVDSFIADYDELAQLIQGRYGEDISSRFEAGAKAVIRQATSILTGHDLSQFLKGLPEDIKEKVNQPAVFCNRYSVTQLPWSFYEMDKAWRLGGVVSKEMAKEFHEALTAIFARTQTNGIHVHLLMTSDEKVIYAYESAGRKGDFVITTEWPSYMSRFMGNGTYWGQAPV